MHSGFVQDGADLKDVSHPPAIPPSSVSEWYSAKHAIIMSVLKMIHHPNNISLKTVLWSEMAYWNWTTVHHYFHWPVEWKTSTAVAPIKGWNILGRTVSSWSTSTMYQCKDLRDFDKGLWWPDDWVKALRSCGVFLVWGGQYLPKVDQRRKTGELASGSWVSKVHWSREWNLDNLRASVEKNCW